MILAILAGGGGLGLATSQEVAAAARATQDAVIQLRALELRVYRLEHGGPPPAPLAPPAPLDH